MFPIGAFFDRCLYELLVMVRQPLPVTIRQTEHECLDSSILSLRITKLHKCVKKIELDYDCGYDYGYVALIIAVYLRTEITF